MHRNASPVAYVIPSTTVNAILTDKSSDLMDGVGRLVYDLIQHGKRWDTVRESRILHRILQHILSSVSKVEAEQWMSLGRRLEKSGTCPFSSTRDRPLT